MMTPAEELRAAAAKLRETASDLGVWRYDSRNSVVCENEYIVAARVQHEDAAWIALMGPDKAEMIATWMDRSAEKLEIHLPHWGSYEGGVDDPPIIRTAEDTAALVEHHFALELSFARAVLGEKA